MSWIYRKFKMYKNAKVIHLIRDPRSVFASWKNNLSKNKLLGCDI